MKLFNCSDKKSVVILGEGRLLPQCKQKLRIYSTCVMIANQLSFKTKLFSIIMDNQKADKYDRASIKI